MITVTYIIDREQCTSTWRVDEAEPDCLIGEVPCHKLDGEVMGPEARLRLYQLGYRVVKVEVATDAVTPFSVIYYVTRLPGGVSAA